MNRFSTGEPDMIAEMRSVSSRIHDLTDYTREFVALGEAALKRGQRLKGAYYLRSAEFFMFANDPRQQSTRRQYIQLMREHFGVTDRNHFNIPYETGAISAYRLNPPSQPKGTIVMFGGFDTYIEDWFPTQRYFASAGYDFVMFDGPGQGSTVEDHDLPFTLDWHKPVGAVLDYFKLEDVTLWGISFGGCLVIRAAAYEPRVHRIVCDDICTDYFEVTLAAVKQSVRTELSALLKVGADRIINSALERAMKADPFVDWGVHHGMQVMGSKTPSEYLAKLPPYRTDDVSSLIKQDVLVLGGTEDFCIPLHQFYTQIGMLTNARSLTARLFTKEEQGHQHCQIGNLGLQHRVIKDWIEIVQEREETAW
jgi:pimeloyl-ACP methyl ester carboxylesterase